MGTASSDEESEPSSEEEEEDGIDSDIESDSDADDDPEAAMFESADLGEGDLPLWDPFVENFEQEAAGIGMLLNPTTVHKESSFDSI